MCFRAFCVDIYLGRFGAELSHLLAASIVIALSFSGPIFQTSKDFFYIYYQVNNTPRIIQMLYRVYFLI